jgi:hypothetical protein
MKTKKPSKAAVIAEQKLEQGYQDSITSGWPKPLPAAHREGRHWECPICVGRLTIQGVGHLYCNNCNEYYTVTQDGDLEKTSCPL